MEKFKNRFINVHLGLSPYYRGSGTNYWPLVNNELEYVGATFMYIDSGIDTGKIIHQIRADFYPLDTPSQIGNRFIKKMALIFRKIIENFDNLKTINNIEINNKMEKLYKNSDYTEESVSQLYSNLNKGMIEKYITEELDRCAKVSIIENKALSDQL